MIRFDWKGKVGYGDIISPICYAHVLAQRNCTDVDFTFHWMHKRGEKYKEQDPETIDFRVKELFKVIRPIDYQRVTYSQKFDRDLDYNHSNYDDSHIFHNLWWSSIKNVETNNRYVVLNTTETHREQFEDYAPQKVWKDPVGLDRWRRVVKIISDVWDMEVRYVDYTTPIAEAIDLYRKCYLSVGYHGSSMWIARYLGCPMLIYSKSNITRKAFPWAQVRSRFDERQFKETDPEHIRHSSLKKLQEVKRQHELFLNTPNLHRLRGERT